MTAGYGHLATLAEAADAAAAAGRWQDLPALDEELSALRRDLPAVAPATALPALRRARAAEARLQERLAAECAVVSLRLRDLGPVRRAARGYGSAGAAGGALDRVG